METFFERLKHGISVIDTGFVRSQFAASYLVIEAGRAAFIDTGPNLAVPRLLAALQGHGLEPGDVDYVIATHVHLDHAGGVGLLMQHLPRARLVVHPRGARHMIDPTALMEGVRAVYGAQIAARDYGQLVPVAAQRVITSSDGQVLELAGRPLQLLDTPGHARHHHCIWDEASRGWFTGDTFGIVYPQLRTELSPYILPATAPVQFDQQALHQSVARLLARRPALIYPTHYGAAGEVEQLAAQFLAQVDAMVAAGRALAHEPGRHEKLKQAFAEIYLGELRRLRSPLSQQQVLELLATDIELNAQGVGVWLDQGR